MRLLKDFRIQNINFTPAPIPPKIVTNFLLCQTSLLPGNEMARNLFNKNFPA